MDKSILAGSSRMAAEVSEHNWSGTPLGPRLNWPQSLQTTVRILLTSRFAMWMAWGDDLTFFCNDAYRPTLGVKSSWALGASARKVWEEIWPDIGPRIEKVLRSGEATWDEGLLLFLERSGYPEETYHTFSYSPLTEDSGAISGMLCVVTEETGRIIGERRLALLRAAGAALSSAQTVDEVFAGVARCIEADPRDLPFSLVYLFNAEGGMARLVSATGIAAGEGIAVPVVGLGEEAPWPLRELLSDPTPRMVANLSARFAAVPRGPWDKPPHQAAVFPIAQQGQERLAGFLVAGINPFRPFDAEYHGFVSLLTGQIASSFANARAYEVERQRADALAELDRAKTTFFSNVSHELRTPLTLILGPIEEILASHDRDLPPRNREMLTVAHRNGLRLLKLVNTLLDFTRIEAGRVEARFEPTDLAGYTFELASVFRSALDQAGMRLIVDCPPLPEPVYIDRDMWEKIVLNLVSNAFKFTLEGEIAVTLRTGGGQAVLAVRDTGTGITEEQLPHIFERFHRVEGTQARTHEGTGIGLALVQELVKLHDGTVSVESAAGIGTTFTVSVPLGRDHLPAERLLIGSARSSKAVRADTFVEEAKRWLPDEDRTEASPSKSDRHGVETRARILLADDNADMREYVKRLLDADYEVTAASNGEEALRACRMELPDLILSDVMMPMLDGFGLLREIRSSPETAHIPVLLLSARAGEESRIEGLSAGADDYLVKPFSARELLATVAAHLELARVRREAEEKVRALASQLALITDTAPVCLAQCDTEARLRFVNRAYADRFGLTPEDCIGKPIREVVGEAAYEAFRPYVERVLRGEAVEFDIEIPYEAIGTHFMHCSYVPEFDLNKTVVGLVAAITDITERRVIEEVLSERNKEVETLNVRLQRAMTETHHRVKNNLQLISALIDMQRDTNEETIPVSEISRLSANIRALSVIHDVLTQETKAGNDQETLSAKAVLDRLLKGLEQATGDRVLLYTIGDVRLAGRQVTTLALVTNELVSNALKHGRGQTEVTFSSDADYARLVVCDDGPGFPAGFDAIAAAHTGLELVENIVSWDLRGHVAYDNRPEGGAQITVTLPVSLWKPTHNGSI